MECPQTTCLQDPDWIELEHMPPHKLMCIRTISWNIYISLNSSGFAEMQLGNFFQTGCLRLTEQEQSGI